MLGYKCQEHEHISFRKPHTVHFSRLKKCHQLKSMPPGRPPDSESTSSDSLSSPNLVFVDDDYVPLQPAPLAPRWVQPQRTRQLPGHLRQFNIPLPPQRWGPNPLSARKSLLWSCFKLEIPYLEIKLDSRLFCVMEFNRWLSVLIEFSYITAFKDSAMWV